MSILSLLALAQVTSVTPKDVAGPPIAMAAKLLPADIAAKIDSATVQLHRMPASLVYVFVEKAEVEGNLCHRHTYGVTVGLRLEDPLDGPLPVGGREDEDAYATTYPAATTTATCAEAKGYFGAAQGLDKADLVNGAAALISAVEAAADKGPLPFALTCSDRAPCADPRLELSALLKGGVTYAFPTAGGIGFWTNASGDGNTWDVAVVYQGASVSGVTMRKTIIGH